MTRYEKRKIENRERWEPALFLLQSAFIAFLLWMVTAGLSVIFSFISCL